MAARSVKPTVWIEKRRSGTGEVLYRVRAEKDGVRLPDVACGPNKDHARRIRDKMQNDLWAGRLGIARPSAQSVVNFAEKFGEYARSHKAENTWRNFDLPAVKSFMAFLGKERDLRTVTREDVEDWKMSMLTSGLAPHTVAMRIRSIKAALGYAVRLGTLETNPAVGVETPKTESVGRVLTPDVISQLLDHLPMIVSRAAWFAINTGLRKSEVQGLDWSWVRRNEEPWAAEIHGTKGGKPRVIHIRTAARGSMGTPREAGLVFAGLSSDMIHSHLTRVCRTHKLGRIRWHDLRHTWATEYMRRTGDLPGLMLEGGWSSLAAVSVYQHLSRRRAEAVELLDFGVAPPTFPPTTAGG